MLHGRRRSLGLLVPFALTCACARSSASSTIDPLYDHEPVSAPEPKPVSVMDNAIHTPDPDPKALQDTAAARFHRKDGIAVIGFCVDVQGRTTDFEVVEPFPGDPKIDEILIATMATWRFDPFLVDGRPIKTCTQKTWKLKFKGGPVETPDASKPRGPLPDSLSRDVCVRLMDLLAAMSTTRPTEAETEQFVYACFDEMEKVREELGDATFERKARCILAASTFEETADCK